MVGSGLMYNCVTVCCISCWLWDSFFPTVLCEELSDPLNGRVEPSGRTPDSTATYSCNEGLELVGPSVRVCEDTGLWTGVEPECIGMSKTYSYADWLFVLNGTMWSRMFCALYTYIIHAIYTVLYCLFHYSNSVPPPNCGDPGTPINGRRLGSDFTLGGIVYFRCRDDFDLVGSKFRECQSNGLWSGEQPTCQPFNGMQLSHISP